NFLGALYDMFGSDAVGKGWDNLTKGLAAGLDGFAKHMDDIGLGLGALQSIIGTMAENFLPILGKVFGTLGKILADNGPQIERAIRILADSFSRLIDDLAPIAERLFPILIDALIAIARRHAAGAGCGVQGAEAGRIWPGRPEGRCRLHRVSEPCAGWWVCRWCHWRW